MRNGRFARHCSSLGHVKLLGCYPGCFVWNLATRMKSHEKSLYGSTAVWLEIHLDQRGLSFKPFVAMEGETVLETPSCNKRGHENLPTPAPRAKRCRKSVVEAEQLASSAAKLESSCGDAAKRGCGWKGCLGGNGKGTSSFCNGQGSGKPCKSGQGNGTRSTAEGWTCRTVNYKTGPWCIEGLPDIVVLSGWLLFGCFWAGLWR